MKYLIAHAAGFVEELERSAPLTLEDLRGLLGGPPAEFMLASDFDALKPDKGRDVPALLTDDGGFAIFKGVLNEDGYSLGLRENKFYRGIPGNVILGASQGLVFRDGVFLGFSDWIAAKATQSLMQRAATISNAS